MKEIYLKYNVSITNKDGFKDYFKLNPTKKVWECGMKTTKSVTCATTCGYLAIMYTIYYNQRHGLFHIDPVKPRIIDKDEAISIINEIMSLLEEFYVLNL